MNRRFGILPARLVALTTCSHHQTPAACKRGGLGTVRTQMIGPIDITVTVDGPDWTDITPEESVALIMARLESSGQRGIVLLRAPYPQSKERPQLLIEALKRERYRVVARAGEQRA